MTKRFPDTSKSDKVPVCASRTCSHLREEGSLNLTCLVNEITLWSVIPSIANCELLIFHLKLHLSVHIRVLVEFINS